MKAVRVFLMTMFAFLPYLVHGQSKCSYEPQFPAGSVSRNPSSLAVCVDKTVSFSATIPTDTDTCDDPREIKTDTVYVRWEFGDGATANGASVTHKYATPGIYTVRTIFYDAATWGDDPDQVVEQTIEIIRLTLIAPSDGSKWVGDEVTTESRRKGRLFRLEFSARLEPASIASRASVTFEARKGANTAQFGATYDTQEQLFYYRYFDLRQRYTTSSSRYNVMAIVSVDGESCSTDENAFCIKKGVQAVVMASDWQHYPYHWGGDIYWNGCTQNTSHGLPADGYYHHYGYTSTFDQLSYDYGQTNHWSNTTRHPACFDCSGYVGSIYHYLGIPISVRPTAASLYYDFPDVTALKKGDMIFSSGLGHVMMVRESSASPLPIWHAPYTGAWTRSDTIASWGHQSGPSGNGWCMDATCSH